jgi:hypothetical protein
MSQDDTDDDRRRGDELVRRLLKTPPRRLKDMNAGRTPRQPAKSGRSRADLLGEVKRGKLRTDVASESEGPDGGAASPDQSG